MKKCAFLTTLLATASLATVSAFAADGQVNFKGEIIDAGCNVVNTESNPVEVVLGKVAKTAFTGAGSVASATTPFTLLLTDCPETATSAKVKFDGNPLNGDNNVLALTQEAGVATGVGVQIFDNTSTLLPLFSESKTYALQTGVGVVNKLDFIARYIAVDDNVTPGPANSTASFTINYN